MNADKLKEYLEKVFHLEASLYNQQALIDNLHYKLENLGEFREEEFLRPLPTEFSFKFKKYMKLALPFVLIGVIVTNPLTSNVFAGICGGLVVALIVVVISEYCNLKLVKENNERIDAANEEIARKNQVKQEAFQRRHAVYNDELEFLGVACDKTRSILEHYYSKDILFPKYRNMIAVSSLYEYLSSGRCDALTGHEGAYNMFENESRQDIIINKLEEVIRHLEQIESSQFMLYTALQKINRNIQSVTAELNAVADGMQALKANTKITAFNSRITDENTEFLEWLETFYEE